MSVESLAGRLGIAVPYGELVGRSTAEMEAEFADYVSMGVDLIRTDFWWQLARWNEGDAYDWSWMEKVVSAAERYGIEVVVELNGRPRWVDDAMSTPASIAAFGDFAAAAAEHFKGRVTHWEIYNEPNNNGIPPENFAEMLKVSYDAIKAVDPENFVISGGLAATPQTGGGLWGAVDYLQKIYANGGGGHFDAVGYHPYTYPLMPRDPEPWNGWQIMEDGIRDTMRANGDGDMDVWLTELGAPTDGQGAAVSQAQQAEMITQAVDLASGYSWAGPILWYSYQDRGDVSGTTEDWFGLVGPNGERKDAYDVFSRISNAQKRALEAEPEPQPEPQPDPDPQPEPDDGGSQGDGEGSGDGLTPTFSSVKEVGSRKADLIVGNDRDNKIFGRYGDDTIHGGDGDDVIWGQRGDDILHGGDGDDRFVFQKRMDNDTIMDFETGDLIDLRRVDADTTRGGHQDFKFIGSDWLKNPGDLGFYKDANGWTSVQAYTDDRGGHDFSIRIMGQHDLTIDDFVL